MEYLPLIMLAPLTKLIVSDFRRREVPVLWLAILAVGTVGIPVLQDGWAEVAVRSVPNLLLSLYMFSGIALWGWVKAGRLVNPVNLYIGLGDIIFFLILAPVFPFRQYILLIIVCSVFSLVWWWTRGLIAKRAKDIPFIATSGIVTAVAIIYKVFFE